jgi:hypothetical protein
MKHTFLFIICFLKGVSIFAQSQYTISGTIKDSRNGEALIGVAVTIADKSNVGTRTNDYGFYSITLEKGSQRLRAKYIGFKEEFKEITLDGDKTVNWELESKQSLKEVNIKAKRKDDNITKAQMGTETINIKEIAKVPVLFGEKDVLKTIQLLPGVKSAGEGNAGFNVRGGSTDQNLILLDEAPVYNASHLLGFFSTFNSDAIKDATIIKGNSPANYGGRLSSVLDVRMKEGNNKKFAVNGGIGLISSRLTVEGPIQEEKSSFMLSGRRTYVDVFLQMSEEFKKNSLYFYDFNAKANYKINEKNRIYLSGYFGRDVLGFGDIFGIDWGNATGTLRWNSLISKKLFSNTSLIYSDYDYNIKITSGSTKFNINSNITDLNFKEDFTYFVNPENTVKFGLNAIHHNLTPTRFQGDSIDNTAFKKGRKSLESGLYLTNTMTPSAKWSLDYGLRLSTFTILGGEKYNRFEGDKRIDSFDLTNQRFGKTYLSPEPRFTANYIINDSSSVKIGYARNTQHLHLLSNSTSTSPTDQWIGNSYNIRPEISDQISVGYSRNFDDNTYELNVEGYYKNMQNQVDYKNGADINTAVDVESELLYGDGRAYGLELTFKKKMGKLTGWIGYTLSRTERKIDGINNGEWYVARQDRTHDLSIVGIYQLTERWSLSALFVYNTGNAVTFPSGKYNVGGQTQFYYTERNGYRMPAYHRVDVSATWEGKTNKKFQSSWNIGLYNIYGRENAYLIQFRDNPSNANETQALQYALFKFVPSITYNFKF